MNGVNGVSGVRIEIISGEKKNEKKVQLDFYRFLTPLTPPLYPIGGFVLTPS